MKKFNYVECGKRFYEFYNLWKKANPQGTKRLFAEIAHIVPQNLNRYFAGEYDPMNIAANIADELQALGLSIDWLATGKLNNQVIKEPKELYRIREYPVAGKIQAGKGAITFDYDRVEPGPPGVVVKEGYWFVVKGDSMEPRYFAGEMVFVRKDIEPRSGDFAVVVWDDYTEGSVKQIFFQEQFVVLKSLNPKYEPIIVPKKEIVFIAKITHSKSK